MREGILWEQKGGLRGTRWENGFYVRKGGGGGVGTRWEDGFDGREGEDQVGPVGRRDL